MRGGFAAKNSFVVCARRAPHFLCGAKKIFGFGASDFEFALTVLSLE
jgi:hypothetical protein